MALSKEAGRITGVMVDDDGQEVEVAARAVVIATGGYAEQQGVDQEIHGARSGVDLIAVGNTGKMGDGIRMAWEAGAAEDGVEALELVRVAPVGPEFAMGNDIEVVAMQPDLYVDCPRPSGSATRASPSTTPIRATRTHGSARRLHLQLFDESILDRVLEDGVDRGLSIDLPPGYKPEDVRKELAAATGSGSTEVFAADSVEELARMIGIDPADPPRHGRRIQRLLRQGTRRLVRQTCQVLASPDRSQVLRGQGPYRLPGDYGRHQDQ